MQAEELFLSTPSARRATVDLQRVKPHAKHFYPRPPRGGRPAPCRHPSDRPNNFYPRPPRGGRRHWHIGHKRTRQFLSTPSARRATGTERYIRDNVDISIHALREEGDLMWYHHPPIRPISIHALREEGDSVPYKDYAKIIAFLSTPSARRATFETTGLRPETDISIHALREEGDPASIVAGRGRSISIHALREEGDTAGRCNGLA